MTGPFDRDRMLNSAAVYLIETLQAQNIEAIPVVNEYGKALRVGGRATLSLENLVDQMTELHPSLWEEHLLRWAQFAVDAIRTEDLSDLDKAELASMLRSRVVNRNDARKQKYARPVAEDLVEILCLDYPNRVLILTDDLLKELSQPQDWLYEIGRANTMAEPIDERFEEEGVSFITGDSMFIASKIIDIPSLLKKLEVDAPDGLLFGIPNRSLLMYLVPTELVDVVGIANMMGKFTPEAGFDNPGGLISASVYYWSPDGSIESMTGDYDETMAYAASKGLNVDDIPRESTMVIRPTEKYAKRFMQP